MLSDERIPRPAPQVPCVWVPVAFGALWCVCCCPLLSPAGRAVSLLTFMLCWCLRLLPRRSVLGAILYHVCVMCPLTGDLTWAIAGSAELRVRVVLVLPRDVQAVITEKDTQKLSFELQGKVPLAAMLGSSGMWCLRMWGSKLMVG